MNHQGKKPLQVIDTQVSLLVPQLKFALEQAGFWSLQSFDLRSARAQHEDCPCPNHGTALCTCELVVLLVYRSNGGPITLVLDGRDGKTYISVNGESGIAIRPSSMEAIEQAVNKAASVFQEIERD